MSGEEVSKFEKLITVLSEREELTPEDITSLTGLSGPELDAAISILRALGFVEFEEGIVRWLGPEVRGRVIIIRGKVDYVIHNPFEVRVFGLEDLRATAKPAGP
ncbi:hypothetical protein B6U66_02140 [Candidatus Bathyarchaeota archaeon ex4484_135]|nr:MAG: hypothetical protein B6U66_02140 [Candidatus Bathyarchaeota archaeon ex4484_135]